MPKFDGVTVALISQYDACTIPEYPPPSTKDPFVESPPLFDPDRRLVSVYAPTYPSSQFWIAYQVLPEKGEMLHPYYYFKLLVDGRQIVSWGCGCKDDYRGKTMFALYRPPRRSGDNRPQTFETRALYFDADTTGNELDTSRDSLEIRAFRCRGRMKQTPRHEDFESTTAAVFDIHRKGMSEKDERAFGLFDAGPVMGGRPRKYYKYALVDPVDKPFVTFRYFLRSISQLAKLSIIAMDEGEEATPNVGSPGPSTLFPSMSMQSIATSIASDTDLARSLLFPLAIDSQKSPSPLRIPPILSIRKERTAGLLSNTDSMHADGQDRIYEFMTPSFAGLKASRHLYLNENSPLGARHTRQADELQERVHNVALRLATRPSLPVPSRIQAKTSREQIFRECVSELLGHSPQPEGSHNPPSQTNGLSENEKAEQKHPIRFYAAVNHSGSPLRRARSTDGMRVRFLESAQDSDDVAQKGADRSPSLSRQRSMDGLKYALRSALVRSNKE